MKNGRMLRAVASLAVGGVVVIAPICRMWCSTCQQDTPGAAHAATGRIVCSRCQQPVRSRRPAPNARICDDGIALDEQATTAAAATASFRQDDWSGQQRVRQLARELKRPAVAANKAAASTFSDRRRFEPPQDLYGHIDRSPAASITPAATQLSANAVLQSRRTESSQIVAWLIVLVGSLALVGGIGLIAWSLSTKQMLHWNLALGLALGGQGTLILGLVLAVSRLWRHSRYAAGKLQDVHARLGQLQQTAEVLTTMRAGGGAPAFYAELARGASPQMLLTNLKGQLDQLAARLGGGW
jgi:hypothetical protein